VPLRSRWTAPRTLALVALLGCVAMPAPIRPGVEFAKEPDEPVLWEWAARYEESLEKEGVLHRDPELEGYVAGVVERLVASDLEGTGLALRTRILRDPSSNAFMLANGSLYVHTGLLASVDNEAQLASVLGHEIAHFTQRHSLREMRVEERNLQLGRTLSIHAGGGLGVLGLPLLLLGDFAVGAGVAAATMGYSRDLEREADRYGFTYLTRAGYDAEEGARFFDRQRRELEAEGIEEPFVFSSHPQLADRMESYRALIAEARPAGSERGKQAYESAISAVLLENAELDLAIARVKPARAAVERHLATAPESPDGWYWQGELARRERDAGFFEASLGHYRHALELAPSHPDALVALGLLHRERGGHDAARPYFERYLGGDPGALDREVVRGYLEGLAWGVSGRVLGGAKPASAAEAAGDASEEELQSFLVPRAEFLERVRRIGVFRLAVPKKLKLPTEHQDDLERWVVSQLATTGLEVVPASEVDRVWSGVERLIRFPPESGESGGAARRRAGRGEWTEAMDDALRRHGGRELRRELGLDAVLVPELFVIPARPGIEVRGRRPALLCLSASAVDLDGTLLYRDGACVWVFEWPDGDGIKLRASRRELESALLRRFLAASSLHALRGVPAPEYIP
jgi:predicted Zn-dependent protease